MTEPLPLPIDKEKFRACAYAVDGDVIGCEASFARSSEFSVVSFQFARLGTRPCASAATADGVSTTVRRQYLSITKGSLGEVDTLLVVAHELEYIDGNTLDTVTEEISEVRRMLHGLLNRMREK